MVAILVQRQAYVEVERLRDQQKVLQQRLGPRQEEAVKIIGDLATVQEKVKQVVADTENKLHDLTEQATEEITAKEATIVTEVETTKAMMQQFIAAWKNMQQA
jgi:ABC-type transporter Mla subunit MlaD